MAILGVAIIDPYNIFMSIYHGIHGGVCCNSLSGKNSKKIEKFPNLNSRCTPTHPKEQSHHI